jgi:hypothetical protein
MNPTSPTATRTQREHHVAEEVDLLAWALVAIRASRPEHVGVDRPQLVAYGEQQTTQDRYDRVHHRRAAVGERCP